MLRALVAFITSAVTFRSARIGTWPVPAHAPRSTVASHSFTSSPCSLVPRATCRLSSLIQDTCHCRLDILQCIIVHVGFCRFAFPANRKRAWGRAGRYARLGRQETDSEQTPAQVGPLHYHQRCHFAVFLRDRVVSTYIGRVFQCGNDRTCAVTVRRRTGHRHRVRFLAPRHHSGHGQHGQLVQCHGCCPHDAQRLAPSAIPSADS